MWIKECILAVIGLLCGAATAAGSFALITSLGIVPRMAGKSSTAVHVIAYENALILGGILGNVLSVCAGIRLPAGVWLLVIMGALSGIFVGCLGAALAEVLQVWPVLYRRCGLKRGMNVGMIFFALGKLTGALYFFLVLYRT